MPDFYIYPMTSNIEKEIVLWEIRISEKEKEASDLSIRIQEIKITLNMFLGNYNSKVGLLYVKLDRLKLKIKEYQHRIELAQHKKVTQEDLNIIEEEVEQKFYQERNKIDELENEASESSEEYKIDLEDEEKRQSLDSETKQEIKKLFRKLAFKFHPDRAKDEKERQEFNKFMADINQAYKNGDIETLKKYMQQVERKEKIAKETPEEKLVRLKDDYETILGIIAKLKEELEALKSDETYKLKEKVDQAKMEGKDLLEQLAFDINEEIAENRAKLDELVSEYKKIIGGLEY